MIAQRTLVLGGVASIVAYFAIPDRRSDHAAPPPVAARAAIAEPARSIAVVPPPSLPEPADGGDRAGGLDEGDDLDEASVEDEVYEIRIPTSLRGLVKDAATGEPLCGATIAVTSAAIHGALTAIADDAGYWEVRPIPPGTYTITYYYLTTEVEHRDIVVDADRITAQFVDLQVAPEPPYIPAIHDDVPDDVPRDIEYLGDAVDRPFELVLGRVE